KGLDIETIKQVVKERIEIYNNRRPHESCNMLTPIQMHDQSKIKTYKIKKSSKNVFAAL
ncbi:MAG: transposase, partial [Flavobacteriales bacterium]|nr:transposase [Flavobacteriales bacterium]